MPAYRLLNSWKINNLLLYKRWSWHGMFWIGYALFRAWPYSLTIKYFPRIYMEYMLLSEIMFIAIVYFSLWLYARLFEFKKYLAYFLIGTGSWVLFLYCRTIFQMYYLASEPSFKGGNFFDIFASNITYIIVSFLFITACKYFKDGYIRQQFEAEKKKQQLVAEINNLKSQIAPHFLFNTLNNLYGLAVEKSEKLPGLMLQLSDLLRHSLYETQKPLVPVNEEINVLKSYMELESVRLEKDLKLAFDNNIPEHTGYQIAPLILIVFMENAFKHARFVRSGGVDINIKTSLETNWFELVIKNNYNNGRADSLHGIGLTNVKRRLELLYPNQQHQLVVNKDEDYYTVNLRLQLEKIV